MKTHFALAVFVALSAACSNQSPPARAAYPLSTAAAKPAVSTTAMPTAATAPDETAAPATSPSTPTPGHAVFSQYDPPLSVPISR